MRHIASFIDEASGALAIAVSPCHSLKQKQLYNQIHRICPFFLHFRAIKVVIAALSWAVTIEKRARIECWGAKKFSKLAFTARIIAFDLNTFGNSDVGQRRSLKVQFSFKVC